MARRVGLLLLLMIAGGCTSTVQHAVIAPNVSLHDGRSCFWQCQAVRSAAPKEYLTCLHTCPDVRIVDESGCESVPIDTNQYACATERTRRFSPGLGFVWILAGLLTLFVVAAAVPDIS